MADDVMNVDENTKSFKLLGVDINAVSEKDGGGVTVLAMTSNIKAAPTVTLGEIATEIAAIGGGDDVKEKIESKLSSLKKSNGGKFNFDKIKFSLKAAYLYISKQKSGSKKLNTEYAIALNIDFTDALPNFPLLAIDNVALSIWNTEKEDILAKMNVGDINDLLELID